MQQDRWLALGAWSVVGIVVLPVAGIFLSAAQPPGLVVLPPVELSRLVPVVLRTVALAACVSAASLALGTWLAWVGQKASYPGVRLLTNLAVLPLAIPSYLLAAILREEFAPKGALGQWLGTTDAFAGFGAAVLVLTISCTPYAQILVTAALRSMPGSEEEAARSLGASGARRFWAIAVPRLHATWAFALTLIALYVVSDFGAVAVLDCRVLTWELYNARGARDAYRIALGALVCVVPIFALIRVLQRSGEPLPRQGVEREPARPPKLAGGPLALAYVAQLFVVGLGLVVPLASLLSWCWMGFRHDVGFAPVGQPLVTTLLCASFGAALTLAAALLPSTFAARVPSRAGWIEQGAYLTSSLPGVLIAFGILHLTLFLERWFDLSFGGAALWDDLDRVGAFLLLGYVMRFLSQGYAAARPALARVDLRVLEAARSLGAGAFRRLRQVWVPAMTPGLAAAYVLLFIAIAKELPITLMLLPAGSQTLAYRIFDAQSEASLPDVGVAGLLLLGLVLVVQLAVGRGEAYER